MKLIAYQYCPKWHLSYSKTLGTYSDFAWYDYWIIVGPFQTRWRGKTWTTHLRRSPKWIEDNKKELERSLEAMKFVKVIKDCD